MRDYKLLENLCEIHAPSGDEGALTHFIRNYVETNKSSWKKVPQMYCGQGFQDTIVLVFGSPRVAIYSHIDSVGYMVGYENNLIPIGSPRAEEGTLLVGKDSLGEILCTLNSDETYTFERGIERGTTLTYKPNFTESENHIISNYLDNRAGVWTALKIAETLENGAIAFSTYEEHGGGSAQFIQRFLYKKYHITKALIADITWVTEGILAGKGCAISMRDSGIPRKSYVNRIIEIAKHSQIPFQLEVESAGGSDGNQLQQMPFSVDWCFVGAPEQNVHSPNEKIHKDDLDSMLNLYSVLMKEL